MLPRKMTSVSFLPLSRMSPSYSRCWIFLLFATGVLKKTSTQIFTFGSCPTLNVVTNFEVDQYLGKWYSNRNYLSVFHAGLDCITVEYTMNEDEITIRNEGLNINNGKRKTAIGKARIAAPGKFTVSFTSNPLTQGAENHLILDTDYVSYAVIWNCSPFGLINTSTAWILTREPNPTNATIDMALAVFEKNNINQTKLKLVNQQDCE